MTLESDETQKINRRWHRERKDRGIRCRNGGRCRFSDWVCGFFVGLGNVICFFEFQFNQLHFTPWFSNFIVTNELHLSFNTSTMTAEKHLQIEARTGISSTKYVSHHYISSVINKNQDKACIITNPMNFFKTIYLGCLMKKQVMEVIWRKIYSWIFGGKCDVWSHACCLVDVWMQVWSNYLEFFSFFFRKKSIPPNVSQQKLEKMRGWKTIRLLFWGLLVNFHEANC